MFGFSKKNKVDHRSTHASRHGQPSVALPSQTTTCISNEYPTLQVPKTKFVDLKGMPEMKKQVADACKQITGSWESGMMNKNGILLWGDPGNGKTAIAKAIAGVYGWPFFEIKASNITSQWIGETPRAIKESFDFVKRNSPCVLLLDEIDSLLTERKSGTTKDEADIRSTLLTELEDIRNYSVIVLGATNYYERLTPASVREGRFDFKIEVKSPDLDARKALIELNVTSPLSVQVRDAVAARYAGFSVKRVISIAQGAQASAGQQALRIEDFSKALRKLQGSMGSVLRNVPGLSELTFNKSLAAEIDELVAELVVVDKLLMHGSKPFKGCLFVGPPGTGKTALAKAISKDAGWAFRAVAGPDILANFDKLEEVYREALDLRPCVIFIDEATELLKERTTSRFSEHINKFLTVIDGFGEPVPDVVFMAATNDGDGVDEAIARRLYRRIVFELPDLSSRIKLIGSWADRHVPAREAVTRRIDSLAQEMTGMSAANIMNRLDTAYKKAVVSGIKNNAEPDFRNFI